MLNLATSPVTVTDWATTRYQQQCARVFDTYMRDVDISPDGSYFVVGTTGAYRAGSLCDAAARWETGATGSGQQPTWVDYTGGDTLYSVAITGTAVYVGGHQRWMNNSFAADRAGPGAVAREGIAALDPVNGLPLSWNPGRDRGVGAFALVATAQGLWIGSDTDRIGRYEYHGRIAFMPLAGGTAVPESQVGTLPGDLFRLGTDATLTRRSFDGTTLGAPSTVATGVDWSTVRGAFVVSGRLYTGHADGTMTVRDFDGTTAGFTTPINLNGLTSTQFPISRITGMFFWNGRLYYTLTGDTRLYYRWFTPESATLGADTFTASGATDGRNWSGVSGMTMASGRLIYATTTGTLSAVAFTGGVPTGTATVLRPHLRRPGSPEACSSSTSPPDNRTHKARTTPVRASPFRYPAPGPAPVAQGTEQLSPKQQVAGSSPARGTQKPQVRGHPVLALLALRSFRGHSSAVTPD